jgi:phosphohistidine swiveling domain-containing protein
MADKELGKLLKTQISLSEWLRDLDLDFVDSFIKEDVNKRSTLSSVAEFIDIPTEPNYMFEALDLLNNSPEFSEFLDKNGDNLYAMRLLPKVKGLEKLRLRGLSLNELVEWFNNQEISHDQYMVNLIDHPEDYAWATIFFVNRYGIHGEIIFGGHHLLTQGFHGNNRPIVFSYSFKDEKWRMSKDDEEALDHLKKLVKLIKVEETKTREELTSKFGAKFFNNYLAGYFETTESGLGVWFIDYNQTLGDRLLEANFYDDLDSGDAQDFILSGRVGSPGEVEGSVRIVNDPQDVEFKDGEILVCKFTSPEYLSLMKKSAGIITDEGGVLSHAAIVARELAVPCVVATKDATTKLKTGDRVSILKNGKIKLTRG